MTQTFSFRRFTSRTIATIFAATLAACSSGSDPCPTPGACADGNGNDTIIAVDVVTDTGVDAVVDIATTEDAGTDVPAATDVVEACAPSCGARTCGDDGCGGSCGMCFGGLTCNVSGSCAPDPTTRWTIEAVDATVLDHKANGDTWDPFGGLPDPLVCISVGTDRQCGSNLSDTIAPMWNYRFPTAVTTAEMQAGVRFEVIDDDSTSANDVIGDVRPMPTDADFVAPVWTVTVGRSTVRVRLTPAP